MNCPQCDAPVEVPEDFAIGDTLTCDCGVTFEVEWEDPEDIDSIEAGNVVQKRVTQEGPIKFQ